MNRLFSLLFIALIGLGAMAQEETVLTIGEKTYSLDEFNYIYDKNNSLTQEPVSRNEYVDLFVNYKLKVEEAIAQGYDTVPSFQKELDYYRNELAKPYLTDKKATDEVVKEAYEHMLYEVDASHILVKLSKSPTPEDTLKAYKKILNIKKQLEKGGDFDQLAVELSEGPSAPNKGHLGYFGAFMMVYPFEKAAYNTPVGEVSEITRTAFGYHLIKVNDKRKNKGEVLVAHIMKAFPYQSNGQIQNQSKIAIDSIYNKLQNGESFNAMVAQFSDDKQTVANNGKLPWFGTGRMVPEFSDAAFSLSENGQVSKPVKTQFGWHIIKRLDVRPIKPLDECREEILQKIKRDERAFAGKKATVERLKKEYNFTINASDLASLQALVVKASKGEKADFVKQLEEAQLTPASFNGQSIHSTEFAHEAFKFNLPSGGFTAANFAQVWNGYVEEKLIEHEKSNLENKYPDFKFLMNEYHDGLLIFEISQKEIWNRASNDSTGLAVYYSEHKSEYTLDEHFDGRLFYCKNKTAYKQLKKLLKKDESLNLDSLESELSDQIMEKEGRFFKGEEAQLDVKQWKDKKTVIDTNYPYLLTEGKLVEESIQTLDEVRGRVISDYQEELEQKWIESLKEKYDPKVNAFVFNKQ
ncbi:peptidylprolyl isomerase [Carboxylicivirga marina]|uniref:Peptidylprolyl isomerase n=1 Tax=Carboxylicivirga marina TaxID=2800988 RepID=A0ABS1HDY5_9BACT|nr:peptidylprolyl isomerase [Carboxylicivirga marina]MBK3515838.1 peptidylprolyl isomerase [Carboxylicivirga marina]